MKNWTRTSLILLAFSIGACESQAPTAPTSSLTQSGALATGAQGQTTTLADVGARDSGIQQAKGGNPGPPGGKDDDKSVAYSVKATQGDCPSRNDDPVLNRNDPLWNAWTSDIPGFTSKNTLFTKWPIGALTVTINGPGNIELKGKSATVGMHKGQIVKVGLYGGFGGVRYTTGQLDITPFDNPSPNAFPIQVRQDGVHVYPLTAKGNKTGLSVGTICVGDLEFTPQ